MPLAATSSTLYIAQRKRLRGKRRLARAWFLGKLFLAGALCVGLAWSVTIVYPLVLEAEYFRVRTVEITGLTTLTREEVLYLLGITEETTLWQLDLIASVEANRAAVRLHDAHQDFDEGAFACAILTTNGVNFTSPE